MIEQCYRVKEVASILKTTEESVLNLISRGDLQASNINTRPGATRPTWRISDTDLGRFLLKTRQQGQANEVVGA